MSPTASHPRRVARGSPRLQEQRLMDDRRGAMNIIALFKNRGRTIHDFLTVNGLLDIVQRLRICVHDPGR